MKGNPVVERPNFNKIFEKVIPSNNKHANEEAPISQETPESGGGADVLARYRIPASTVLDDEILTPSKASKVRFNISEPRGFSFPQVEEFYGDVVSSLDFYVHALESRDRDVHRLATEIDKYIVDLQNARYQIEVFESSGGKPMTDAAGNFVTADELSEEQSHIITLEREITELRDKLLFANGQVQELKDLAVQPTEVIQQPEPISLPSVQIPLSEVPEGFVSIEEVNQRNVELDMWEKEVTEAYEELEGKFDEARNELERVLVDFNNAQISHSTLEQDNNALKVQLEQITLDLENLKAKQYTSANTPVVDSAALATLTSQASALTQENNELKAHVDALNEHINTLDEYIENMSTEEVTVNNEPVVAIQDTPHGDMDALADFEDDEQILNGINISKLPPGVTAEDLF